MILLQGILARGATKPQAQFAMRYVGMGSLLKAKPAMITILLITMDVLPVRLILDLLVLALYVILFVEMGF